MRRRGWPRAILRRDQRRTSRYPVGEASARRHGIPPLGRRESPASWCACRWRAARSRDGRTRQGSSIAGPGGGEQREDLVARAVRALRDLAAPVGDLIAQVQGAREVGRILLQLQGELEM